MIRLQISRVIFQLSTLVVFVLAMKPISLYAAEDPKPDWKFIETQLKAKKFKKSFITKMKESYDPSNFEEVVKLNVLLFLRKSDYHGPQVTDEAATEVQNYIKKYRKTLDIAEKRHKVPAEVIVSLIWLESRLGENKGAFHVPSVYLHLLQAKRSDVVKWLKTQTDNFTDKVSKKQLREIGLRSKRKSDWAVEELRAIQKIYSWKWSVGQDFRGSFAGAFGMPQFIPSSYTKWARSVTSGAQPILSKPEDAIMSVAFYLKDHGWKNKIPATRITALMKYNNSRDYALAILALAKRAHSLEKLAAAESDRK